MSASLIGRLVKVADEDHSPRRSMLPSPEPAEPTSPLGSRLLAAGASLALLGIFLLLLFAAAGPLATDDLWWHLTLGHAYIENGAWLTQDARLHTAIGPPAPNSWLFDVSLAQIERSFGLSALRPFHVGLVASILTLAWLGLKRTRANRLDVGVGCGVFIACATYRLLQLRPSLLSIAACLLLYLILTASRELRLRESIAAVALCGLWANVHAGFLLGPLFLFATSVAEATAAGLAVRANRSPSPHRERAFRMALTAAAGLAATLVNPIGFQAHRSYASAGLDAVGRGVIADEWRGVDLLSWPLPHLPPTPLPWLCLLILVLLTLWIVSGPVVRGLKEAGTAAPSDGMDDKRGLFGFEPALLTFGLAGLVAPFFAVRFLWMLIFPVALVLSSSRPLKSSLEFSIPRLLGLAALSATLLWGYVSFSDWTILAPRADRARYLETYSGDRYFAHSIWFLSDSGVEGNLFNAYFMGGFAEYWLGPQLQTFVDGSLNFPAEVFEDYLTIQSRGARSPTPSRASSKDGTILRTEIGSQEDAGIASLLDRHQVDLFIGIGLPVESRRGRPWRYTTSHLEREPDWLLVFRDLQSAVYLREGERNENNLDRIAAYYQSVGVPFDRERGFDVVRVLEKNPTWAIEHGMAPLDFPGLVRAWQRGSVRQKRVAGNRLAATWAALGAYERALLVDDGWQTPSSISPVDLSRQRRSLWCLLRLDRLGPALERAEVLAAHPSMDRITRQLIASTRKYATSKSPQERAEIAALSTLFSRRERGELKGVQRRPPIRR